MKRLTSLSVLALLMALLTVFGLASCVGGGPEEDSSSENETSTGPTEGSSEDATEGSSEGSSDTEKNTSGSENNPVEGDMAGLIYTEYVALDFATESEREYAKLNGQDASITFTGIDGGSKGGVTNAVLDFCCEPNFDTTFTVEVNGEKQYEFTASGGSGWFEMQQKTFSIKLNAGKENTITVINTVGKISHINTITVGDKDASDAVIDEIDKNANAYEFKDAKPASTETVGVVTYAKLDKGKSITLTGVDGGNGGLCDAYISGATKAGGAATLKLTVNDNRTYLIQIGAQNAPKYGYFTTVFNTFLKPGKTNTVTIEVTSGATTLLGTVAFGETDGSQDNPYVYIPGEEVGSDMATLDQAVKFLEDKGIIDKGSTSLKTQAVGVISKVTGSKSTADALYSELVANGELTQKNFLAMLIRGMGYAQSVTAQTSMRTAQVLGIVKNVPSSSYGDVGLDKETMAMYVYNALSAKCADGKLLGEKLGVESKAEDYNVKISAYDFLSKVSGNNAIVNSEGGISTVSTVDTYKRFSLTADVKADKLNGFIMGFRLKNNTDTVTDSGVWIKIVDQHIYLMSGTSTAYCEVPMGLFNVTEGASMKIVDNGESINIYSVVGAAEAPLFEIRFIDNYAVAYVRGHLIHSVPATKIPDSGYIAFGSCLESVEYKNIKITAPDPVLNLNSEYPEVGAGKAFEITETFDNGMYDYNAFFGTGSTMKVEDGKLVFKAGRENIFSTIMRVENGVLEAEVLPGSGEVQFQIGAGSNMARENYLNEYYCGLRFTVKSGVVELFHDVGNMDEEANLVRQISRSHGINVSEGYSIRLYLNDKCVSFWMKGKNDTEFKEILRGEIKVSSVDGREYFSILDSKFEKEAYHFDKLMREFGYIRITSEQNAVIDNVHITGNAYLPYEQMEILPAPEPDPGKKLEADNVETLVGTGYLPYFTRFDGVRPSVEDLLPKVIEAAKLTGDAREQALDKLYWGYAWWAEPAQGMYCGRDSWAAYKNLEMIGAAGIDFIYIDHTNFNGGCTPDDVMNNIEIILEAALKLDSEGKPYPKISFWNSVRNEEGWAKGGYEDTAREIWQVFIANPRYRNLWVYYHGKVLMMYTFGQPMEYLGMTKVAEIREMWVNSNIKNTWSFHHDPQYMDGRGGLDAQGNLEQLYVLPYGKTTYSGNLSTLPSTVENGAGGREGGLMYQKYWEKVFEERPKFVMIWAYNHWDVNFKRPDSKGTVYWGDNFSTNYSGGIEPIAKYFEYKGVKYAGDSYYQWTIEYIKAYKAGKAQPMDLTYQNPKYQVKN